MDNSESSFGGGFLLGLLVGAAGGAALSLLYAPSTGEDAREYWSDRAREGRDRATAAVERGKDMVRDGMQRGRDIVEQGREMVDHGREVVSTAMNEGRDAYRQTKASEF